MVEKTKIITKRRKFIEVDIPLIKSKVEIIGNSLKEIDNRTIKLDLTRNLKGKSLESIFKIKIEEGKALAYPIKIKLMPYFIRRMIRKRISYVEDSFESKSQESLITIKPFLITRKKVSKAIRKTLRNKTKNWLEDYIAERKDNEIFSEILMNKMQRSLSLMLKKTYPLSLCEIRILEIKRPLKSEEIPKIEKKEKIEIKEDKRDFIDQLGEFEKIKQAEKDISEIQKKAAEIEKTKDKKIEEPAEEPKTEEKPKKKSTKKKSESK